MSDQNDTAEFEIQADVLATVTGGRLHGTSSTDTSHGANGKVQTKTDTYTVGKDDNLSSIARATHQTVGDLVRRNPQYGKDPNLIHPGDRIVTGRTSTHD